MTLKTSWGDVQRQSDAAKYIDCTVEKSEMAAGRRRGAAILEMTGEPTHHRGRSQSHLDHRGLSKRNAWCKYWPFNSVPLLDGYEASHIDGRPIHCKEKGIYFSHYYLGWESTFRAGFEKTNNMLVRQNHLFRRFRHRERTDSKEQIIHFRDEKSAVERPLLLATAIIDHDMVQLG